MPTILTPQIPASQLAQINPGVLSAGGQTLQFDGLIVDSNLGPNGYPVVPVGMLLQFASSTDVSNYFGATSQEAGLASVYFTGPINKTKSPNSLYAAGYALGPVGAYLLGGATTLSLSQLQAIDAALTVTIDGAAPITQTVNLASATSFSNAASIIGNTLGIKGIQIGAITASLSSTTMTVTAIVNGIQHAVFTASTSSSSSTLTVTAMTSGYIQVGDVVSGTGITAGTTITGYTGSGAPGGVGTYTMSAVGASTTTGSTITAYASSVTLAIGQVVTGTGITAGTYISALGTGTGGIGTYTLSASATTEPAEAINVYATGVEWSVQHSAFKINSGTTGTSSSVSFASGAAATSLSLTQALGSVQSLGAASSVPGTFMSGITAITQNWVKFMTTWEPTDTDKEAFSTWVNGQNDQYAYSRWSTDVLDTETGGPAAPTAFVNTGDLSGTVMIYENPAITTLAGEKAAFNMSWSACLDFTRQNGRQTAAFKGYVGGQPDITNGTIAEILGGNPQTGTQGWGVNFYGAYTTRTQAFPMYQRGFISGPFEWEDSYINQIWMNNSLQQGVIIGMTNTPSVPYNTSGSALIEGWCLPTIQAALNFGAIQTGVQLSAAQAVEVNTAAGAAIDQVLYQRGWYLQILPASAQSRGLRISPPITFWYMDGESVQAISIASILIQ
ncbi:MAG: DUF3383 family protein [Elusimicrobia bacterium]|nr:DUF3383 family protein [Elusimicrobiota bacterium]